MIFTMKLVGVVNRFWYDKPVDPGHSDYTKQLQNWDNYTALVYNSDVETIELLIDDDNSDFDNDIIKVNNVVSEIEGIQVYRKWNVDHDDTGMIGLTTDYSVEGLLFKIPDNANIKSFALCGGNVDSKTLFIEVKPNPMFANLKLDRDYKVAFVDEKWYLLTEFS